MAASKSHWRATSSVSGGLTCDEYANDFEQCYQVAVDVVGPECDLTENSTPVDSASR